jgi:hypothetical protein
MKKLKKTEMLGKHQELHCRAERNVLATADNAWVVKLFNSFQAMARHQSTTCAT